MLRILVINLITLLGVSLFVYIQTTLTALPTTPSKIAAITLIVITVFILVSYIILSAITYLTEYNWRNLIERQSIRNILKMHIRAGIVFGIYNALIVLLSFISFQFYASINQFYTPIAIGLLMFAFFLYLLGFVHMFSIHCLQKNIIRKTLKKSFLLAFDNPIYTISVLIFAGILLLLSTLTAFLFPGVAGTAYFLCCATKLRLLKYEGDEPNIKPDWNVLLKKEREILGTRSLKNLIFPWK